MHAIIRCGIEKKSNEAPCYKGNHRTLYSFGQKGLCVIAVAIAHERGACKH